MKTVFVAIAYDNDLLSIGEDKEAVKKQAEENVKENFSQAYSLDKYEVEEKNGCFSFKLLFGKRKLSFGKK